MSKKPKIPFSLILQIVQLILDFLKSNYSKLSADEQRAVVKNALNQIALAGEYKISKTEDLDSAD